MLTVSRLTGGVLLLAGWLVATAIEAFTIGDQEIFLLGMGDRPKHGALPAPAWFRVHLRVLGDGADFETLNLFGAEAIDLVDGPRPFQVSSRSQHGRPATGWPKRSSKPCSPASMKTIDVESNSTAIWARINQRKRLLERTGKTTFRKP